MNNQRVFQESSSEKQASKFINTHYKGGEMGWWLGGESGPPALQLIGKLMLKNIPTYITDMKGTNTTTSLSQ